MTNHEAERRFNEECAVHIRAYWARRGRAVKIDIVDAAASSREGGRVRVMAVRSDLRFTMPTRLQGAGGGA
ncbi:regulator [Roseibium sp. TrichSKD4]|uniref:hypothetical protein n=1 Tax=Roseibium sp. TrichSKD4 TaxID=744980 RepID=UPI0001E56B0C|nr:hypothetical protein [Roseibium sp. TrichSKD4]EFO32602.1 regulator [Roseibium sp. TrichSKD4]